MMPTRSILRCLGLWAAVLVIGTPAFAQPVSLPLTTGAANKQDAGFFAGGTVLNVAFSGIGDLVDSRLQVQPSGSLFAPALGPYTYANAGATNYPTNNGGDGVNHFPGGGLNFDATGSGYGFAGLQTTDTLNPGIIRDGAVVGTFVDSPAGSDWFLIGSGATLTVPASGAHLYLAVNDSVSSDNHGFYTGTITPVPEPAGTLLAVAALCGIGNFVRRRRTRLCLAK